MLALHDVSGGYKCVIYTHTYIHSYVFTFEQSFWGLSVITPPNTNIHKKRTPLLRNNPTRALNVSVNILLIRLAV